MGRGIEVDPARVPIYPETRRVCELLDADPFGLIGSGSLLIACDPEESRALIAALTDAGVEASDIATVIEGEGVTVRSGTWPRFAVDEVARLLAEL